MLCYHDRDLCLTGFSNIDWASERMSGNPPQAMHFYYEVEHFRGVAKALCIALSRWSQYIRPDH